MRARMPVDEVSVGDYVLAGGEAAVLVMVEAVGRLLPGVLGNACSAEDDSFGGLTRSAGPTRPCAGCWKARCTPGRVPGVSARCPRSCCRATTPRSRAGGATWPCAAPPRYRPDLIPALRDLDRRDEQVLAEAGAELPSAELPSAHLPSAQPAQRRLPSADLPHAELPSAGPPAAG